MTSASGSTAAGSSVSEHSKVYWDLSNAAENEADKEGNRYEDEYSILVQPSSLVKYLNLLKSFRNISIFTQS